MAVVLKMSTKCQLREEGRGVQEKAADFQTEVVGEGVKRISSIGVDPWMVKQLTGTVKSKRPDARKLTVTPLDFNGYPAGQACSADPITLQPTTVYYLVSKAK